MKKTRKSKLANGSTKGKSLVRAIGHSQQSTIHDGSVTYGSALGVTPTIIIGGGGKVHNTLTFTLARVPWDVELIQHTNAPFIFKNKDEGDAVPVIAVSTKIAQLRGIVNTLRADVNAILKETNSRKNATAIPILLGLAQTTLHLSGESHARRTDKSFCTVYLTTFLAAFAEGIIARSSLGADAAREMVNRVNALIFQRNPWVQNGIGTPDYGANVPIPDVTANGNSSDPSMSILMSHQQFIKYSALLTNSSVVAAPSEIQTPQIQVGVIPSGDMMLGLETRAMSASPAGSELDLASMKEMFDAYGTSFVTFLDTMLQELDTLETLFATHRMAEKTGTTLPDADLIEAKTVTLPFLHSTIMGLLPSYTLFRISNEMSLYPEDPLKVNLIGVAPKEMMPRLLRVHVSVFEIILESLLSPAYANLELEVLNVQDLETAISSFKPFVPETLFDHYRFEIQSRGKWQNAHDLFKQMVESVSSTGYSASMVKSLMNSAITARSNFDEIVAENLGNVIVWPNLDNEWPVIKNDLIGLDYDQAIDTMESRDTQPLSVLRGGRNLTHVIRILFAELASALVKGTTHLNTVSALINHLKGLTPNMSAVNPFSPVFSPDNENVKLRTFINTLVKDELEAIAVGEGNLLPIVVGADSPVSPSNVLLAPVVQLQKTAGIAGEINMSRILCDIMDGTFSVAMVSAMMMTDGVPNSDFLNQPLFKAMLEKVTWKGALPMQYAKHVLIPDNDTALNKGLRLPSYTGTAPLIHDYVRHFSNSVIPYHSGALMPLLTATKDTFIHDLPGLLGAMPSPFSMTFGAFSHIKSAAASLQNFGILGKVYVSPTGDYYFVSVPLYNPAVWGSPLNQVMEQNGYSNQVIGDPVLAKIQAHFRKRADDDKLSSKTSVTFSHINRIWFKKLTKIEIEFYLIYSSFSDPVPFFDTLIPTDLAKELVPYTQQVVVMMWTKLPAPPDADTNDNVTRVDYVMDGELLQTSMNSDFVTALRFAGVHLGGWDYLMATVSKETVPPTRDNSPSLDSTPASMLHRKIFMTEQLPHNALSFLSRSLLATTEGIPLIENLFQQARQYDGTFNALHLYPSVYNLALMSKMTTTPWSEFVAISLKTGTGSVSVYSLSDTKMLSTGEAVKIHSRISKGLIPKAFKQRFPNGIEAGTSLDLTIKSAINVLPPFMTPKCIVPIYSNSLTGFSWSENSAVAVQLGQMEPLGFVEIMDKDTDRFKGLAPDGKEIAAFNQSMLTNAISYHKFEVITRKFGAVSFATDIEGDNVFSLVSIGDGAVTAITPGTKTIDLSNLGGPIVQVNMPGGDVNTISTTELIDMLSQYQVLTGGTTEPSGTPDPVEPPTPGSEENAL